MEKRGHDEGQALHQGRGERDPGLQGSLVAAFAETSRAWAWNLACALQAEKEGLGARARLFRAVAEAKSVQARRFLGHLRGSVGTTEENLRRAIEEEQEAARVFYPPMIEISEDAPWAVKKAFAQTMETARGHGVLCEEAAKAGGGAAPMSYHVCRICGHISTDGVPKNCPVCHAVPGRFKEVP